MMRKHFENLLGIATGSDMSIKFAMNVTLQYSGFKAEGIVDQRCWVTKTHYPYRLPFDPAYKADYAVCCLRNPLDSFVSFFNMFMGMTHTNTIKGDFLGDELFKFWNKWLKAEVSTYKFWHDHWLNFLKETNIPVFFFRFEDIL